MKKNWGEVKKMKQKKKKWIVAEIKSWPEVRSNEAIKKMNENHG